MARRHLPILVLVLLVLAAEPGVVPRVDGGHPDVPPPLPDGLRAFVENRGQIAAPTVRFYTTGPGLSVGFAPDAVLYRLYDTEGRGVLVRESFPESNPAGPEGRGLLPHRANYFLGNDPTSWRRGVPAYREIVYPDLWEGIDLVYRTAGPAVKYEYELEAGAVPERVAIAFAGQDRMEIVGGELVVRTPVGVLRDAAPVARQGDHSFPCAFRMRNALTAGIACDGWDRTKPGVIDPLVYATYLGGQDRDEVRAMALDAAGNLYVTGQTGSTDFPTTPGAFDRTYGTGFFDAYIAKLNPTGSALVYATYLGGNGDLDIGLALTLDGSGNVYVTGQTSSPDFPITATAYDGVLDGPSDAFVTELSANGDLLVFSTFLGGTFDEGGGGLVVDQSGSVLVVGTTGSPDFPTTAGAFSRTFGGGFTDAFVATIRNDGGALLFGTFLGGAREENALGIALDPTGAAFVAGATASSNFPVTPGAFDTTYNDVGPLLFGDAYVVKFLPTGAGLAYGTFLGGATADSVRAIALDPAGRAIVTGITDSAGFPTTPGAMNETYNGNGDAFIVSVNSTGDSLRYGTFLGGSGTDDLYALALDASGRVYVAGGTTSPDFPTTPDAANGTASGGLDVFLASVNETGANLLYGTYLGGARDDQAYGLAVDLFGNAFLGGYTVSSDLPTTPGAFDRTCGSDGACDFDGIQRYTDGFVAMVHVASPLAAAITIDTIPAGLQIVLDGTAHTAPYTFVCLLGSNLTVDAPSPQFGAGTRYTWSSWSDGGAQAHGIACTGPATYTARFDTDFQVTVDTSPPNRQVAVDGSPLVAPVAAWWPSGSLHTVGTSSPQVAGQTRFVFVGWSDGGAQNHTVLASGPGTYVASFRTEHETTIDTSPGGLRVAVDGASSAAPYAYWCVEGSPHTLDTPSPQPGGPGIRHAFVSWSDGGAQNHTVGCPGPATYTATFAPEFQIVADTLPTGLQFEYDGVPYGAPQTFWCRDGSTHLLNAPSPQFGSPTVRYVFLAWSDNGTQSHAISCTGPVTYTALFETQFRVIVDTAPTGLVVAVDGGNITGPTTFWWAPGTVHPLAVPSPQGSGSTRERWVSWSDGGARNHSIAVVAPTTLTATFVTEHEVVLLSSPSALTIEVDGLPYRTPAAVWLGDGETHTFGAPTPQGGASGIRYPFSTWTDSPTRVRAITITGPLVLQANFGLQYQLNATSPYGTPRCDIPDCWYDAGWLAGLSIEQNVSGTPGTRYHFAGWTGDVTGAAPLTPVLMDRPKNTTATWTTQHLLQLVSIYGNATCDVPDCWYAAGTTAGFRVVATEVTVGGERYRFAGWSGDYTGTASAGTIPMDGPRQVVANWEHLTFVDVGLWVWFLPIIVAFVLLLFLLWRRRKRKEEPDEGPKTEAAGDAGGGSSDLKDDVDLDRGTER